MTNRSGNGPASHAARIATITGAIVIGLTLLLLAGWGVLAIWFARHPLAVRIVWAGFYGVCMVLLPLLLRPRRRGMLAALGLFALVAAWFFCIPPSNHRDWQPDVAALPWAEIKGAIITVHKIRNCDYRSETDYACRYYDKTFDLDRLQAVDMFLVHWGSRYIAHPMMSWRPRYINPLAQAADKAPDFSQRIRESLPVAQK